MKIVARDIGPVRFAEFEIPEKAGVLVFQGGNENGKTTITSALRRSLGDKTAEVPRSYESDEGTFDLEDAAGFGVRLHVGAKVTAKGRASVRLLAGEGEALADVINPGLKDVDAAEQKRIRALAKLVDLEVTLERVQQLAGGPAPALRATTIIEAQGYRRLGPPENLRQLRQGALAIHAATGRSEVEVAVAYLDSPKPWVDTGVMREIDLDATADEARRRARTIQALRMGVLRAEPTEGAQCRYCPAFDSCAAKANVITALSRRQDIVAHGSLTPEGVAVAYNRLLLAEDIVRRARGRIGEAVERLGSVPMPGGGRLVFAPGEQERIDPEVALEVAGDYDAVVAEEAVRLHATKSSILDASRGYARRIGVGSASAVADEIIARIRDRGGIRSVETAPSIREIR